MGLSSSFHRVGLLLLVFGAVLGLTSLAGASGGTGFITWSDDVSGTTTKTGSVFGSKCGSGSANAGEEAATLALSNTWAASAAGSSFTQLSVATTPADDVSGDSAVLSFPGVSNVTATVSRRQIAPGLAADPTDGSTGALSNNAVFSDAARLQDCAPRPADLTVAPSGMTLAGTASFSGLHPAANRATFWNATTFPAGNQLDAALFEFSEPVGAFGLWFGDLETRPPVTDDPFGAVLAIVKLLDAGGNVIESVEVTPDEAVTDDATCGGGNISTDGLGCGNQATRFIGFVEPAETVAAMLVIVGDDDSCVQASRCEGITEYLSWIGPMLALPQPDLVVSKTLTKAPTVTGDTAEWAITISNIGAGEAAAGWTVEDLVGSGLSGLTLTGDPAEADCAAGTACTGLVALAPSDSVTVTATATHDALPGVSVDNLVHVAPHPGDIVELIPAGPAPTPGDDTSATPTNNDAEASHSVPPVTTTTSAPTTTTTETPTTTSTTAPTTTSSTSLPPTTTTVPVTTTSETPATSSAPPSTAIPTTTAPPAATSSSTSTTAATEGTSATPTTTPPESTTSAVDVPPGALAFTGGNTDATAVTGVAFMMIGSLLMLASRLVHAEQSGQAALAASASVTSRPALTTEPPAVWPNLVSDADPLPRRKSRRSDTR